MLALAAVFAWSAAHAQSGGPIDEAPIGATASPGSGSEDPIQEGRDGMRILGTITVAPGTRAPVISDDEVVGGPLSADHMAWSEAAKNAYAARQYGEARSLYRRGAQGGRGAARMIEGRRAATGHGGPPGPAEAR
ncbi:MAG: hypothetical protein ACM30I_09585, partial [Gemmatimonas sp.]